MIRMFDYECRKHGVFDVMITTDDVPEYMECICGDPGRRVWRSAPSMNNGEIHAIELGGRTFRRDDMEALLDQKNDAPAFYEKPEFKERVMESLSRNAYKEMHGTLPPATAPIDKEVEKSLGNVSVDPAAVKASSEKLTEVMRRTEFKE